MVGQLAIPFTGKVLPLTPLDPYSGEKGFLSPIRLPNFICV